ncbi:MAG: hypothetical protein IJ231_08210 [Clostridia bacterium]|nr:hypothetical protein [Clostridia bacterium]
MLTLFLFHSLLHPFFYERRPRGSRAWIVMFFSDKRHSFAGRGAFRASRGPELCSPAAAAAIGAIAAGMDFSAERWKRAQQRKSHLSSYSFYQIFFALSTEIRRK